MGHIQRSRRLCAFAATAVLLIGAALPAAAAAYDVPYAADYGYHYNVYGEAVPSPALYTYTAALEDGMQTPTDLFIRDDELYVLDAGNSRVAVFGLADGKLRRRITPSAAEGAVSLSDARGLYVTADKSLYITLYEQKKLVVLDGEGRVKRWIGAPQGPLIPEKFTYYPTRVAVQDDGTVYVVSEGTYQGLIQLDPEGAFVRFFGSNQVTVDTGTVFNMMWRKIFNREQQARMENTLPVDYSSLTLGSDGFLYSTTATATTEEIKKHGPTGSNILAYNRNPAAGVVLDGGSYGDFETYLDGVTTVDTRFTDLAVGATGLIHALDTQRGRIFTYDQNSHLLGIFGVIADQNGGFHTPVSIEEHDGTLYVLDKGRGQVMVFQPTAYAEALMTAVYYYGQGLFAEAAPYWTTVRGYNTNLALCAAGLGWAALEEQDYSTAMGYFRQAQDKTGYNQAFLARRSAFFSQWAFLIFLVGLAAIVGLFLLIGVQSRKGAFSVTAGGRTRLTPFHVLCHPSVGFEAMKDERMGSNIWALILLLALFVTRLLTIRYTGYLFNPYRPETVNMLVEFVQIMAVFAAFVLCSWAVGTLVDSEARMGEIFRASTYALCPYILFQLASVLLSNALVLREGTFIAGLSTIGLYWSAIWMVVAIIQTHKFTLGKTILFIVLVLVGIFFVLFLCVMFYSLASQFGTFLSSLYQEILFRL